MNANIINIQRFSIHDGPGIRTTVFLKGCNLRCRWCHNPESQLPSPELQFSAKKCIGCGACVKACPIASDGFSARFTDRCQVCGACTEVCFAGALSIAGEVMSPDALLDAIEKDAALCRRSGGGVTFSGGEPLLQAEFLAEILPVLRERGIHTAIETAAHVPWAVIERLLPHLNLVMCDIKCMDPALHREHTGAANERILDNIRALADNGIPLILRTPIIPGFNDNERELDAIGRFAASLGRRIPLELLPFHSIGRDKYASLQRVYDCENLTPPTAEHMQALAAAAAKCGADVSIP